jgi:hypothetical protein
MLAFAPGSLPKGVSVAIAKDKSIHTIGGRLVGKNAPKDFVNKVVKIRTLEWRVP